MKNLALILLLAAAATPAIPNGVRAQTPGLSPGQIVSQSQANLNQFQAQLQTEQLQRLQRQNTLALQQPDPALQAQALARQQQIQQQIDQTLALQQQMSSPSYDPANVNARLQQNNAQIQQLQGAPILAPAPSAAPR